MQLTNAVCESLRHKVAGYDMDACNFSLQDCNETLTLLGDAGEYTRKIQYEMDLIRARIQHLRGTFEFTKLNSIDEAIENYPNRCIGAWGLYSKNETQLYIEHIPSGKFFTIKHIK